MNTVVKQKFAVKPVVAALALAFSAVAYADPTPFQLPGQGSIRAVNPGTTISSPNVFYLISGGGAVGGEVYNGTMQPPFFPGSIQLNNAGTVARAVIRWGGNGATLETYNPAGFNVGQNATVYFTSSDTVTSAAVLNIDASGNSSQIFGRVISDATGKLGTAAPILGVGVGAAPVIFISNANGITVGPSGEISSPNGMGLLGANLNNSTAMFDFVGDNSSAYVNSYLNVTTGQSKVWVQGALDGGIALTNLPAKYVLLAGGDVVNQGNVYANNIEVVAGMRATATTDTINGITGVTVNRLFNVTTGLMAAGPSECTTAGCFEIAKSGSTFINEGSMSSKNGSIRIAAAKGIRSGILGSPDQLVGLFADSDITTNVYESGGNTELYNVIGRYSVAPNTYITSLNVNQAGGWDGDVTINALTRGSAPSSVTTNGLVNIRGVNVHIDSTINHLPAGVLGSNVNIVSTNSVSITKAVGAGDDVNITNSGAGGINIAAAVTADVPNGGIGTLNITNTGSGSPTTISGNLTTIGALTGDININVNGPLNVTGNMVSNFYNINITNNKSGAATVINNVNTWAGWNVNINVNGPSDINSGIWAQSGDVYFTNNSLASGNTSTFAGYIWGNYVDIHNEGATNSNLNIDSSIVANDVHAFSKGNLRLASVSANNSIEVDVYGLKSWLTGPETAGNYIDYWAPNAMTSVATAAVLTAPTVYIEALNFKGVQNSGADYTSAAQKPNAQIVTDNLYLTLYGSMNSPLAAASNPQNNWLLNSMWTAPWTVGGQVYAEVSAVGGGFQAINLGFRGDVAVNSGYTLAPFWLTGFTQPAIIPPFLGGNLGSSLIVQADGNMDIFAGFVPGLTPQFLFPGGVAFVQNSASGYLSINAPINNAWTFTPQPFQGQWFQAAGQIFDLGYHATNFGSWVNYNKMPVNGAANAYVIQQTLPGLFQFVPEPNAIHQNTYSSAIVGGAICNVPSPPWPAC